ncbi:hypothetical protein [Terribacillus saccharophilus]|uniref:hypothetical protein n=1 Tax=Terribacillus saccharophilus TaxID=361277 RepID=UPI002DD0AFD3|nr:hypothetical protein [Terribacillus saccharophilus]MEC0288802.1 hypothetical protein [Terribacillus saccharophilus]
MAIPDKIKQLAKDVRSKTYGVDVREAIARSMEETGDVAETARVASEYQTGRVDNLIRNNPQPDEVVDIRYDTDGVEHATASQRIASDLSKINDNLNSKVQKVNTISQLKTMNLEEGEMVLVYSFYNIFDGATHYRKVESQDDGSGIQMDNGLYANIFHSGAVSVKWFGAISINQTDYKDAEIQRFFEYIKTGNGEIFSLGDKVIYLQLPSKLVYTETGGNFTLLTEGGELFYKLQTADTCLQIGLETPHYSALTNVRIPELRIKAEGQQSHVLELFTRGNDQLAFWNSSFGRIRIAHNRGKGLAIYNGVFECQFDTIRVDTRRKYLETTEDPLTNQDISLYLANEEGENIVSSLLFNFVNTWGGWHNVRTQGINRYAPGFTANEVHCFDAKREGLYLDNQQSGDFINKLHLEFHGEEGNPVYGCFWNGYGRIGAVEGGSDHMLGYIRVYNGYDAEFRLDLIGRTYNMPLKEAFAKVDVKSPARAFIATDISNILMGQFADGVIECLIQNKPARIKLNGSDRLTMNIESDKEHIYTDNQGVTRRVHRVHVGYGGVTGGLTTQDSLDLTTTTKAINWELGNGVQNNVRLGFYGAPLVQKPIVQGGKGGNAALTTLIKALSDLGLITDQST